MEREGKAIPADWETNTRGRGVSRISWALELAQECLKPRDLFTRHEIGGFFLRQKIETIFRAPLK
jgi:hypothetical protein